MITTLGDKQPKPAIVIPVYKASLSSYEWISIARTFSVLGRYPIFLLSPAKRIDAIHESITSVIKNKCFEFHVVEDHWLDSIASYNHLLLTPEFYSFYKPYTHILVAQLDSYVFQDELLEWCLQPWAYIGAPIYPKGAKYGEENCLSIGCGGFSLRHVGSFLQAFEANPTLISYKVVMDGLSPFNWKGRIIKLLKVLLFLASTDFRLAQSKNGIQSYLGINEDVVFGRLLPQAISWFKVPTYAIARRFSIDSFIKEDLSCLDKLPFGTHAWYSFDDNIKAWISWIPELESNGSNT